MPRYVNPEILSWARERAGFTIDMIAKSMKKDPAEVASWESGTVVPSYSVLERLAQKLFKVPVAVFYFPEPPDIEDPMNSFRRLPEYELMRFSPDTLGKIRLLQAFKESLVELDAARLVSRRVINDIKPSIEDNLVQLSERVRDYVGVSLAQQIQTASAESAVKLWRHALEVCGIFTFKDSLKDSFVSGFCIIDPQYPVIMINNSTAFSRQLFTLIHETAHILYQVNGVTDESEEYFAYLEQDERNIEIRCNALAGEILVPRRDFSRDAILIQIEGVKAIPSLAEKYSVSREVILRRLLDLGLVSRDYYRQRAAEFAEDYRRATPRRPGGNYYLTKMAYLGEGFTGITYQHLRAGRISPQEAANHLNINARNLAKFERYLR